MIVYYLIFPLFQNSIIEYYVLLRKDHLLEFCWTSSFYIGLTFYIRLRPLCHLKVPPKETFALNAKLKYLDLIKNLFYGILFLILGCFSINIYYYLNILMPHDRLDYFDIHIRFTQSRTKSKHDVWEMSV